MYLKRALVWLGYLIYGVIEKIVTIFWRTVGFRIYKLRFLAQRYLGWVKNPWQSQIAEIISRRGTLQIVLFVICFFILFPQSKLFAVNPAKISGHDTLLYSLVGPGEQDFAFEEVAFNQNIASSKNVIAWNDTAVSTADSAGVNNTAGGSVVSEIAGISSGGLALTKPTIMPGTNLPVEVAPGVTARTETIIYEVQPEDVIGKIASNFGISVDTILWANNLTARSYIRPGDKLKILPASGLVHLVKKGENVGKIALIYNVSQEDIIKVNRLQRDGSDISIGEELLIPGGKKIEPIVVRSVTASSLSTPFRQVAAAPASIDTPAGSGYLWPAGVRRISQYYGWKHTGLDIAGPVGTPIYAARSGKVITAQGGYNGGYGNYIVIDHGGGVQTAYGHSRVLYVSAGEQVKQGQVISAMGSTGRSTGPHLHFEVRVSGVRVNPLKYIR